MKKMVMSLGVQGPTLSVPPCQTSNNMIMIKTKMKMIKTKMMMIKTKMKMIMSLGVGNKGGV